MLQNGRLFLFIEERFVRSADGGVWTTTGGNAARWDAYLEVFDELLVVARVGDDAPSPGTHRVEGPRVRFVPVPYFRGMRSFLKVALPMRRAVRAATLGEGSFILRLLGAIGMLAGYSLLRQGKPYGVELVGDPDEVFKSGVGGAIAPILRRAFTTSTRRLCANAAAVSYVTAGFLQKKYPPSDPSAAWFDSPVEFASFASPRPRTPELGASGVLRILTAGSLEQRYKGVDILLRAISLLQRRGLSVAARIAGEGVYRAELEQLTKALDLTGRVAFLGFVPKDELIGEMDQADLFVLASRSEGLPRVIIEAMSRGLPVIATNVGGIPELLDAASLVPPENPAALALAIGRMAANPAKRLAESARNISAARNYLPEIMDARRGAFLRALSRAK